LILITPPQVHISIELLSSAGISAINTVGAPGAQGAGITGTQGMGVKTPRAAAVAEATVGFAIELHIPNGGTFTMGLLSMMLAAGVPVRTHLSGNTTREDGAAPKLHCNIAPIQTCIAINVVNLY
jgi:hypothetical protein